MLTGKSGSIKLRKNLPEDVLRADVALTVADHQVLNYRTDGAAGLSLIAGVGRTGLGLMRNC
jgi:hypothetical protein